MTQRNGSTRRWRVLQQRLKAQHRALGSLCHICVAAGKPLSECTIDYEAAAPAANSFSADHVFPVAQHPWAQLHEAAIRPAHLSCNKRRGAKPLVDTRNIKWARGGGWG